MKRFAWVPILLLLALAAIKPAAAGGFTSRERLDPTLSCQIRVGLGGYMQQGGMLPVLFEFENSGESRLVSVRTGPRIQASATFSVPAGSGIQRFLYLPVPFNYAYHMRNVWFTDAETGRELAETHVYNMGSSVRYLGSGPSSPYMRTVTRSSSGRAPTLAGISLSGRKTFAVNEDLDSRYKLQVQKVSQGRLPDRWVGYTCLNLVILDYDVWQSPSLRREPLMHWMAMGGVCLLVDAPSGAKSGFREQLAKSTPFVGEWQSQGSLLPVGMGHVMMVDSESLTMTHRRFFPSEVSPRRTVITNAYDSPYKPDVQGVGSLPFWPVLLLLTVFAALVGPLGWWYLVGKKQMGLLYYIAAPTLSLTVIALVVVADIFHEGVTPKVSCHAVRLLDQRVKKAVSLSQFGIYAPFSLGGDLEGHPDEVAHFLSMGDSSRSYSAQMKGFSIRRASDRRIYGGVLPAREKAWFGREWIGLERRRLVVWEEDGRIAVENHLDCDLKDLLVHLNGKYAEFESLAAGQKATAHPSQSQPEHRFLQPDPGSWIQGLRSFVKKAAPLVKSFSRERNRGNFYAAEAEGCLDRHVWVDSFRPSGTSLLIVGRF